MLIIFHYSAELPQMLKGGGCLGCMEISFPPGTRGAGCCHYTQMSFPLLASSSNLSTTLSRNEAAWAQQGCREKRRRAGCCPGLQTVFLARPPFRSPLHRARPREELPAWRRGDGPQNGGRTGGGWHGRRCLWAEGRVKWGAQMEGGSQQRPRARGC